MFEPILTSVLINLTFRVLLSGVTKLKDAKKVIDDSILAVTDKYSNIDEKTLRDFFSKYAKKEITQFKEKGKQPNYEYLKKLFKKYVDEKNIQINSAELLKYFFEQLQNNLILKDQQFFRSFQHQFSEDVLLRFNQLEEKTNIILEFLKNNTVEKKEKEFEEKIVLKSYLEWLIIQHEKLELRGIREKHPNVSLEKVYVALKGDHTNKQERIQSYDLLESELDEIFSNLDINLSKNEIFETKERIRRQILQQNPFMLSLLERDKSQVLFELQSKIITLGEAFQREKKLVILGDPGSGKTTLARWLTLKFAKSLLNNDRRVVVPKNQVDPESENTLETVNLGESRLPILMRISNYADALLKAKMKNENLQLVDYLGNQSWLTAVPKIKNEPIPPTALNLLIKKYLRQGKTLIILDGMDEITDSSIREDVVHAIEIFIEDWVNPTKSLENNSQHEETDNLNQIIITSRIAGYHSAPIRIDISHVTIEPMNRIAVEHFCDVWTHAVYHLQHPDEDMLSVKKNAGIESEELKSAIFDPKRPRIQELATNPLLITILALVHHNHRGLPQHRIQLYKLAMEMLSEDWTKKRFKKRNFETEGFETWELEHILSPLAAYIHQNYSTGIIQEHEISKIIAKPLSEVKDFELNNKIKLKKYLKDFLKVLREDVGLLAARGEKLYGFVHLTFQEYLAALSLVKSKEIASENILQKLDDPRWHEPILLALGHIGTEWGQNDLEDVLDDLLKADDPISDLIPRISILIVNALDEMEKIPNQIIEKIIINLLSLYSGQKDNIQFNQLSDKIEEIFSDLRRHNRIEIVDDVFSQVIMNSDDQQLINAAAKIIFRQNWISQKFVTALLHGIKNDTKELEWPIHQFLQKMTFPTILPDLPKKYKKLTVDEWKEHEQNNFLQYKELKLAHGTAKDIYKKQHEKYNDVIEIKKLEINEEFLPFRKFLIQNNDLVDFIQSQHDWLILISALYGGYYNYESSEAIEAYRDTEIFLLKPEAVRNSEIRNNRKFLIEQGYGLDDPAYNAAVTLDTLGLHAAKKNGSETIPTFTPKAIITDSPLTPYIIEYLNSKKSLVEFSNKLWDLYENSTNIPLKADSFIALTVIGKNPQVDVKNLPQDFVIELNNRIKNHASQIFTLLRDSTFRSLHVKIGASNEKDIKINTPVYAHTLLVEEASGGDLYRGIVRIDQNSMKQQNISPGNFIEIQNLNKKTTAKCYPLHPFDDNKKIIRIDPVTRHNLDTKLKATVTFKKVELVEAQNISVKEFEDGMEFNKKYLSKIWDDFAVRTGDIMLIPHKWQIPLQIVETNSNGNAVVITKNTNFDILSKNKEKTPSFGITDYQGLEKHFLLLLKQLISKLDSTKWLDVFTMITELNLKSRDKPLNVEKLLVDLPEEYKAKVLAEYWVNSILGGYGEVGLYDWARIAEMMNRLSPKLIIESFWNIHNAKNLTWKNFLNTWDVEMVPPKLIESIPIPYDVIQTITNLYEDELRPEIPNFVFNEFVKGIVPLLKNNADLIPELLLEDVHRNNTKSIIYDTFPELRHSVNSFADFKKLIISIKDPYFRSRALIRLAQYEPEHYSTHIDESLNIAKDIDTPYQRCLALEHLIPFCSINKKRELIDLILESYELIDNPESESRLLIRISRYLDEDKKSIQHIALDKIKLIVDEHDKSELLIHARYHMQNDLELLTKINDISDAICDIWYKSQALELRGSQLLEIKNILKSSDEKSFFLCVPMIASAVLFDLQKNFNLNIDKIEKCWSDLIHEPNIDKAYSLYFLGIKDGLLLSKTAVIIIDELIKNEEHQTIVRLLFPLLQEPKQESIPIIEKWLTHSDEFISNHAALFLAEKDRILNLSNIDKLVSLLREKNDRTRFRIFTFFNNPVVNSNVDNRVHTSKTEKELLEKISLHNLKFYEEDPKKGVILTWFWETVIFDNPIFIKEWINEIEINGNNKKNSIHIIKKIKMMDNESMEELLKGLMSQNSETQIAVFYSICSFFYNYTNKGEKSSWKSSDYLLSDHSWTNLKKTIEGLENYATPDLLNKKIRMGDSIKIFSRISDLLENKNISQEEAKRAFDSNIQSCVVKLKDILSNKEQSLGNILYEIGKEHYWGSSHQDDAWEASKFLEKSSHMFPLLINSLEEYLTKNDTSDETREIKHVLLTVAAAGTIRQPSTFANLAKSTNLEELLTKATLKDDSFVNRLSAIILLSHLKKVNTITLNAIRSALQDVKNVKDAAIETITNFNNFDDIILSKLIEDLYDESAIVSYISAQILASLGHNDKVSADQRKTILLELTKVVRDSNSMKGIYDLPSIGKIHTKSKLHYTGSLNEKIYRELLKFSGIV